MNFNMKEEEFKNLVQVFMSNDFTLTPFRKLKITMFLDEAGGIKTPNL